MGFFTYSIFILRPIKLQNTLELKFVVVLGTRPEIVKLAPIINKLNNKNSEIIFTGQHYDYNMSLQFINQLEIRRPNYSFKLSNQESSLQMGEIIIKLSKILKKIQPDTVIVQGDTNTVLATSITSLKLGIPISHVESGLRSFDWRMPEEHNRIATDHLSEFLFAPTNVSKNNLISEKVHGKIFVTGNTVIDAIDKFANMSKNKSKIHPDFDFVLMTLHRSENVDNKQILSNIIQAVINSQKEIIFPVHPRTIKMLKYFDLYKKLQQSKKIHLMSAIGYFEMLELMKRCSFIITDSGGIQEEATSPRILKKVVVVRKTTDRPEAVHQGFSVLTGLSYSQIISTIQKVAKNPGMPKRKSPYGNGNASVKIISTLKKLL